MQTTAIAEDKPEIALADLGVRPELLTAEERRKLDVDGLVVLEDVIPQDQLEAIREHLDAMLASQQLDTASDEHVRRIAQRNVELYERVVEEFKDRDRSLEDDQLTDELLEKFARTTERLRVALDADDLDAVRAIRAEEYDQGTSEFVEDDLFETDPLFDLTLSSPRVLSAVHHVLGPMFHILNLVARCPKAGEGQQVLHRTEYGPRRIATTLWLIDDMTLDNGPTRVVIGAHQRSDGLPPEMEGDPTRPHPDETLLTGKAGSVVVFDDRCWHGGSLHHGGGPRRVVISSYTQRSLSRPMEIHHPEKTLRRLSPGQLWLLHA
jgi:ectoine hydroxylase-related dioxygenase (phytanoyl-CoA dioxygenase family)